MDTKREIKKCKNKFAFSLKKRKSYKIFSIFEKIREQQAVQTKKGPSPLNLLVLTFCPRYG